MRVIGLCTSAIIAAGAVVTITAAPASAAGSCTLTPHVPSRLSITTGEKDYTATITGCTGNLLTAGADLTRSGGPSYETYFLDWSDGDTTRNGRTAHFTVYDFDRPGTYKTADADGVTKDGYATAWHSATTSLRYGSWTSISSRRAGSHVYITTAVSRYDEYNGRVHYAGRLMTFQARHSVHDGWSTIGYARTNSVGRASIRHTTSRINYYRVVLTDISTVWGSASGMSHR